MIVQPLVGRANPDRDGSGGQLLPYQFMVSDYPVGADPRIHPIIPVVGSTVVVGGLSYTCDRVRVAAFFTDTSCLVEALFSTDARFRFYRRQPDQSLLNYREWDLGFASSTLQLPKYTKGTHAFVQADGTTADAPWWFLDEEPIPFERKVLSVQVNVDATTNGEIQDIITQLDAQVGRLHQFDFPPNTFWVMQPYSLRQRGGDPFATISYSWINDPGTGEPDNPDVANAITAPRRPPFYSYIKFPARGAAGVPSIDVFDLFPFFQANGQPNPYVNLNGWRTLPGNPL